MMTDSSSCCIPLLSILLVIQTFFPVSSFFPSVPIRPAPVETWRARKCCRVVGSDCAFCRLLPTSPRRQSFANHLHQSALVEPSRSKTANETRDTGVAVSPPRTARNDDNGHEDYPWTDMQGWTLRDQVPRYSIQIETIDSATQKPTIKVYALWRTLVDEVPELAGYPLPFLASRYHGILHSEAGDAESPALQTITDVLPFLDEFEFTKSGGMTGLAYVVQGVADGTRIETSAVGSVEVTIPKGFVETQDGLLYELGRPVRRPTDDVYSLSSGRQAMSTTADFARGLTSDSPNSNLRQGDDAPWDPELTQFGALTAFVVVGALAFETLQHHLTVNIFWV